jgi:hypothetical protein
MMTSPRHRLRAAQWQLAKLETSAAADDRQPSETT